MSPITLGILAGSAAGAFPYWFATYEEAGYNITTLTGTMSYDKSSIYVTGRNTRSSGDMFIANIDPAGKLLFAKNFDGSTNDDTPNRVRTTANGNVYISGNGGGSGYLQRLNASGVIQFQKLWRWGGFYAASINDITPIGNEILVATSNNNGDVGSGGGLVLRVNESGTITHSYNSMRGLQYGGAASVTYDGTNVWSVQTDTGNNAASTAKFSDTLTHLGRLAQAPGAYISYSTVLGSYLYTSSFNYAGTNRTTTVWRTDKTTVGYGQPKSYTYVAYDYGTSVNPVQIIKFDSSGNLYFIDSVGTVIKLNSSMQVQWQRLVNLNGSRVYWKDLDIDAAGDLYLYGSGANKGCILKMKADGSQIGTYAVGSMSVVISAGDRTITQATTNVNQFLYTNDSGVDTYYQNTGFTQSNLTLTSAIGQVP